MSTTNNNTASTVERQLQAGQQEMAFYVVVALTIAMALTALGVAVYVYNQEAAKLRQEIEARKTPKPGEPGFDPKETQAQDPKAIDRLFGALITQPWFLWAFFNFFLLLFGVFLLMSTGLARPSEALTGPASPRGPPMPAASPLRVALACIGGLLGFTTTCLLGIGFAILWWNELSAGIKVWRELWPWLVVLAILGGLMTTFVSLVSVKSEERRSPALRRILYGFNAGLVGLLLLAILVVGNALVIWYGPAGVSDWTQANIYSISGESKRLLRSLDKPVRVHVILDAAETLYLDVKNLLENCRTHAADFEIEYVRLTRPDDLERIDNLLKKYGYLGQFGLLVLYDPDGTDVRHQFIKRTADGPDDLGLEDMPRRGFGSSEPPSFRGEQALMSVLRSFVEGQDKLVVYVTQDSGEMSLTDTQVGRPGQFERYDRGLHLLKTNLEKQGYEVKEWNLGAIDENTRQQRPIPADAFAVLIADPAPTIAGKLKPVEDFLRDRKGRLIVLLEPRQGSDGQVEPTGLEELARKQGVNIGTDIVLRVPTNAFPDPTLIIVGVARAADGPLRTAIASQMERRENLIYRARSVSPAEAAPADREVSPLLQTRMILALEDGRMASGHWAETALKGTPTEFLENLAQGEGRRELLQRILGPAVTVAVTVRDKGPLTPSEQPGMPPMPAQGEPRMVFIGDATLASNTQVQSDAEFSYNVLSSSLSWLRGKQVVIGTIKPKERASYRPNLSGDDLSRLRWLPATLLLLFIVAVGVTVGIMRRRAS